MPRNIEIKARIDSIEALLPRARAVAGTEPELIAQDDTFFNVPHGRLKLREFADGSARPGLEGACEETALAAARRRDTHPP